MPNESKIQKIFSEPDVKHGLSLFTREEIDVIERLIIEVTYRIQLSKRADRC